MLSCVELLVASSMKRGKISMIKIKCDICDKVIEIKNKEWFILNKCPHCKNTLIKKIRLNFPLILIMFLVLDIIKENIIAKFPSLSSMIVIIIITIGAEILYEIFNFIYRYVQISKRKIV